MFHQGKSGNPTGRPPGNPNKVTGKLREALGSFIESKVSELPQIWKDLNSEQKIVALTKLAPFVLPKLSTITMEPEMTIERFLELPSNERVKYIEMLKLTSSNKAESK